jgi:hypothetical protein
LGEIPFHASGPLVRWLMSGGDIHPDAHTHIAVHEVGPVPFAERAYCEVHEHAVPEFNLILPVPALSYMISLDDERYEVNGPASIYIPPGVKHSANVAEGHGYFIAILLGVGDYARSFEPIR